MSRLSLALVLTLTACSANAPLGDGHLSVKVSITGVSPPYVPSSGGTEITVSGENFPADATVTVDGVAAPGAAWRSAERLTFVAPPLPLGAHDVVVTAAGTPLVAKAALRVFAGAVSFAEDAPAWGVWPSGAVRSQDLAWRTGDVDGDGLDDVVLYRRDSTAATTSFTTYLGSASGTARAGATVAADFATTLIALVDVDGDGRADLIDSQNLHLATASGFAAPTALVAAGDRVLGATKLNDGRVMLLVVHADSSVSLASTDGTLSLLLADPPVDRSEGYQPEELAVLDFDGDGHDDLAYLAADHATILHGPTFADGWTIPGAFTYLQARHTDVDLDGKDDLVVADFDHITLAFAHDAVPTVVSLDQTCGLTEPMRGFAMATDGVAADRIGVQCAQRFVVLGWDGARLFQRAVIPRATETYQINGGSRYAFLDFNDDILPRFARLRDADADSADLLLSDHAPGQFETLYAGNAAYGSGLYAPAQPVVNAQTAIPGRFPGHAIVGLTKDGHLVAQVPGASAPRTLSLGDGVTITAATACDLDGTGQDQIVAVSSDDVHGIVARWSGDDLVVTGGFDIGVSTVDVAIRAFDADGDGRCDIFLDGHYGSGFYVQSAGGTGWTEHAFYGTPPWITSTYPGAELVADLDGDGDDDFMVSTPSGVWFGENQGGANLVWRQLDLPQVLVDNHVGAATFAKGREIVMLGVTSFYGGVPLTIFSAHLAGNALVVDSSTDTVNLTWRFDFGNTFLADFDGDGVDDFLSVADQSVLFARGLPGGGFADAQVSSLARITTRVALQDVDGDGLVDLLTTSLYFDGVFVSRDLAR